jgi:hypothetical protein
MGLAQQQGAQTGHGSSRASVVSRGSNGGSSRSNSNSDSWSYWQSRQTTTRCALDAAMHCVESQDIE